MTPTLLASIIVIAKLAFTALIAGGYATYLLRWLSPRIEGVPQLPAGRLTVISAVVAPLVAWVTGVNAAYPVLGALVPLLIVVSAVDARTKRIPNPFVIQALFLALLTGVALALSGDRPAGWLVALAWAAAIGAIVFLLLLGLNVLRRGGIGMGDVKFGAPLAVILIAITSFGWGPVNFAFLTPLLATMTICAWFFVSFFLGGVFTIARGGLRTRKAFPFGPFLAAGFVIALLGAHGLAHATGAL